MSRYDEDDIRDIRGLSNGQDRWGERPSNRDRNRRWYLVGVNPPGEGVMESPALVGLTEEDEDLTKTQALLQHCPLCGSRYTNRDEMFGHTCPASPRPKAGI